MHGEVKIIALSAASLSLTHTSSNRSGALRTFTKRPLESSKTCDVSIALNSAGGAFYHVEVSWKLLERITV